MDLSLTDEQQEIHEAFKGFFTKEVPSEVVRESEADGFDPEVWRKLVAMGAVSMSVPAHVGGGGAGLLEAVLVVEQAGRRLAPVPLVEAIVGARVLASVGHPSADRHVTTDLGSCSFTSVALRRAVEGTLPDVPNGIQADAVVGMNERRLVLATRPASARPRPRLALGGVQVADWSCADAIVLSEDDAAETCWCRADAEWRLLTAALLGGLASEALRIGVEYVKGRQAFGVPIGSFQAVAHRLADVRVMVDGLALLVREAAWATDSGLDRADLLATMAFAHAVTTSSQASSWSLHFHGGYGFTLEYDIQLYAKKAKAWALVGGDPRRAYVAIADRVVAAEERE